MKWVRQVLGCLRDWACPSRCDPAEEPTLGHGTLNRVGLVKTEEMRVAVTLLSGERLEFPPLPVNLSLREVKEKIKEQWGLPIVAQRLMHGTQILTDADETSLGQALRGLLAGEGEIVELSCIRDAIPEEAQELLDASLLCAAASGDYDQMAQALSEGAQPGESGITCLMVALAAHDEKACGLLRQAGAAEPDMEPTLGSLGRAFERRDLVEVVRLLHEGADPNTLLYRGQGVQDTSSGTALHACCALHKKPGATALVHLLCRLGANTMAVDGEGDSPLSHARYFGGEDIYRVLEARGARLQGPYYNGLNNSAGLRRFIGFR